MSSEYELKQVEQANAGVAAEQELRVTSAAFDQLRDAYHAAWAATAPADSAGREKLWLATTVLSKVQESLLHTVRNGRVAAKIVDEIRKAAEAKSLRERLSEKFS